MNYLLDKKTKRNRYLKYAVFLALFFILVYSGIIGGFSFVTHFVFKPVIILGNSVGDKLSNLGSYFSFKRNLVLENENLKLRLYESEAKTTNYNSILNENLEIKEILSRKPENKEMLLASVLSKSNHSPYDTIIIDAGETHGISKDQKVFAFGNIPIGRVSQVYARSALVTLYSSPGEKTGVYVPLSLPKTNDDTVEDVAHNTFMEAIGRGGGNFEMILLRDFVLKEGTEIVLPGIVPFVLGKVKAIIS
ncbi:MAG: rod shape-determining protein MreC, partial [Patescibacteria group bacterium]